MKKNLMTTYLKDFGNLLYPNVCYGCGKPLLKHENQICLHCEFNLPKTHFDKKVGNPIEKIFWGRADIFSATSFVRFEKGSVVQRLLHALKYNGKQNLGVLLGELIGQSIYDNSRFSAADIILPVPLHPKKFKKRTFNQSECLANGLGKELLLPVSTSVLTRKIFNPTQTRKSRFERWENVEGIFEVQSPESLQNKHVLLVDDVITTGSTLEACTLPILKCKNTRISIVTFAYA